MVGALLVVLGVTASLPASGAGSQGPRLWCAPGAAEALEALPACLVPEVPERAIDFVPAPYGAEVRSLRLRRSATVREAPRSGAAYLGNVAQDMRVVWKRAARGLECPLWIEIAPRGWLCERHLEPSARPPRLLELPLLDDDDVVPGTYGKVSAAKAKAYRSVRDALRRRGGKRLSGSLLVRQRREVRVGKRVFWQTQAGQLIEARRIRELQPSDFFGAVLGHPGLGLPLAWAMPGRGERGGVPVTRTPGRCSEPVRRLEPRELVEVLGATADGAYVRVGEGEWVAATSLRVARAVAPPPVLGEGERWIDVDLTQQVLVAYEGAHPVFATLVSTGAAHNPTPEGLFRIWVKMGETDMTGRMGRTSYRVEKVPWAAFFHQDFGLHAAYWHDGFGAPRSNGCVNLTPADAHTLYFWTEPQVPPGWSMVYARPDAPGTLIRVRRSAPPPCESTDGLAVDEAGALGNWPSEALALADELEPARCEP